MSNPSLQGGPPTTSVHVGTLGIDLVSAIVTVTESSWGEGYCLIAGTYPKTRVPHQTVPCRAGTSQCGLCGSTTVCLRARPQPESSPPSQVLTSLPLSPNPCQVLPAFLQSQSVPTTYRHFSPSQRHLSSLWRSGSLPARLPPAQTSSGAPFHRASEKVSPGTAPSRRGPSDAHRTTRSLRPPCAPHPRASEPASGSFSRSLPCAQGSLTSQLHLFALSLD